MTDPWLPPWQAGPLAAPWSGQLPPYGQPGSPYGIPYGIPYGQPMPVRRRHAGLIWLTVFLVMPLIAVAGFLVLRAAGDDPPGDGSVTVIGPSGSEFRIVLPPGFEEAGPSDPEGGYLTAGTDGGYPPYLYIYADSRTQSKAHDLAGTAQRIQAENGDHGASLETENHNVTVNGRQVAQWEVVSEVRRVLRWSAQGPIEAARGQVRISDDPRAGRDMSQPSAVTRLWTHRPWTTARNFPIRPSSRQSPCCASCGVATQGSDASARPAPTSAWCASAGT